MCETERWRPVDGWPYEVSSHGRVRGPRGWILKPSYYKDYARVIFNLDKQKKSFKVHRLVALAFIPNPQNHPVVNHIDRNRGNNHVSNLAWADHRTNSRHCPWCDDKEKTIEKLQKELDKLRSM